MKYFSGHSYGVCTNEDSIQGHSCCSWSFVLIITIDHERPRMTTNENVVRGLFWSFLNKLKITTNDKESKS